MNRVRSFAAINDTDQWAVLVDGRFQLFPSQQEAVELHHRLCLNGVEYSIFDSCGLMPPHTGPAISTGGLADSDRLSQFHQTDLLAYAAQRASEQKNG